MSFLDIENRRAIIDRRGHRRPARGAACGQEAQQRGCGDPARRARHGRAEIARRLADEPGNGRAAAQATAFLHDQLVRLAYDFVCERMLDAPLDGVSRWLAWAAPAAAKWRPSATST